MLETFIALLFAHALADFVFQTKWMVDHKKKPTTLLTHGAVVLVFSQLAMGRIDSVEIIILAAAHLVIDWVKTRSNQDGLAAYLIDQAAHFATIITLAVVAPQLWSTGWWAAQSASIPHAMLLISGFILTTRAGAFAIGKLMDQHSPPADEQDGLPAGGLSIGYLERGLIFVLVIAGQAASIGFLIAAKSILRFGTVNENRAASEYVIIGTLASFGWAILVSLTTVWLQSLLPALEIAPPRP